MQTTINILVGLLIMAGGTGFAQSKRGSKSQKKQSNYRQSPQRSTNNYRQPQQRGKSYSRQNVQQRNNDYRPSRQQGKRGSGYYDQRKSNNYYQQKPAYKSPKYNQYSKPGNYRKAPQKRVRQNSYSRGYSKPQPRSNYNQGYGQSYQPQSYEQSYQVNQKAVQVAGIYLNDLNSFYNWAYECNLGYVADAVATLHNRVSNDVYQPLLAGASSYQLKQSMREIHLDVAKVWDAIEYERAGNDAIYKFKKIDRSSKITLMGVLNVR